MDIVSHKTFSGSRCYKIVMRQILKQLNFSDKEIDIYLTALKMGSATISELAKKAGIKRPTVYVILEKLKERGLVSMSEKKGKQIFIVESPEKLLKIIGQRKEELTEQEKEIKKSLPKFKALTKKDTTMPLVRYYEGKEGVWNIFDDLTESGVNESWIIVPGKVFDIFGLKRFTDKVILRRKQAGIKIYAILDHHSEMIKLYEEWRKKGDIKFREYRLLPGTTELNTLVYIYSEKVALIFLRDCLSGLIIENKELFSIFKFMFDSLWKELKGKNLPR